MTTKKQFLLIGTAVKSINFKYKTYKLKFETKHFRYRRMQVRGKVL